MCILYVYRNKATFIIDNTIGSSKYPLLNIQYTIIDDTILLRRMVVNRKTKYSMISHGCFISVSRIHIQSSCATTRQLQLSPRFATSGIKGFHFRLSLFFFSFSFLTEKPPNENAQAYRATLRFCHSCGNPVEQPLKIQLKTAITQLNKYRAFRI